MKFEDYNIALDIKKSLAELGFKRPTDIQYKAIGPVLKGEDVLAIAQTGTGKTAAFVIPVLHLLLKRKPRAEAGVKCVVMVPSHELAIQIDGVFKSIGKYCNLTSMCLYGGVDKAPQVAQLEKGIDILVVTPGRMFDLLFKRLLNVRSVEILILDEADRMLDMGFLKDIQDVIKLLPLKRQTLFFSATINETIKDLAYSLVRNPIRIQLSPNDPVSKNITHAVAFVEMDDKRFFLERIIRENAASKILVFVRTKVRAERVKSAMDRVEIECVTIHGDKEQKDRELNMSLFATGEKRVLIATDVSARGIDIPNVDFVINYDLPDVPENYVHRIGRTGRGVQKGKAVSFCSTEEKPVMDAIEEYLGKPVMRMQINANDYLETIDLTAEVKNDWKTLLKEAEGLDDIIHSREKKRLIRKNKK
jgi:ATP-dependent RNA helicase RhlE